jgi:hypothetical protein
VHEDDRARVASEICAHIPAAYTGPGGPTPPAPGEFSFDRPVCEHLTALWLGILHKNQHRCKDVGCPGCRQKGPTCQYNFPQPLQQTFPPTFDPATNKHLYYCPRPCDRNTVSAAAAHATCLCLAWL